MYAVLRAFITFIYKCVYNLSFEGTENIPQDKCCVYASNHRSYADPVFISLKVSKKCSYMAKEELFKNKAFSWLIRTFGAFPVTRGKGDSSIITVSADKLREGRNLVIFPEGTRSKDGKVGNGKSGVALIAAKSDAYVVPVGIVFDGELKFRKKVTVKYGKPISPDELKISEESSPRELKRLKETIMGSIKGLVEGDNVEN